MSWGGRNINLPGSAEAGRRKFCQGACQREVKEDGGVQMNASKWVCASCWINRKKGKPA